MSSPLRNRVFFVWVWLAPVALALAGPATGPGDDVMRPTALSLRMTWPIARYMSQAWMQEMLWHDLDLTDSQQARISEVAATRMMALVRERGAEAQPLAERVIEMMILLDGPQNFAPETSREFAENLMPLVQAFRDWAAGIPADSRPYLTPRQQRVVEKRVDRLNAAIAEANRRMQLWKDGQFKPGEDPFDNLEVEGDVKADPDSRDTPAVSSARRGARSEFRDEKKMDRAVFLAGAEEMFKFDEGQRARGQTLLQQYARRAQDIQTPEWRKRLWRNRLLYHLQFQLGNSVPRRPWVARLQQEWNEATRPIEELNRAFYADVLRLPTSPQWASVHEEVRKMVGKYGFSVAEAESFVQRLAPPPASQPEMETSQ